MNYKLAAMIMLAVICLWQLLKLYLNDISDRNPIPENVKDLYNAEDYEKWRAYHREKNRLAYVATVVSAAVTVLLIVCDVLPRFAFGASPELQALSVMAAFTVIETVCALPTEYIDTMIIEQKYGFNRTTKRTFLFDRVKELFITLLLSGVLTLLLCWLYLTLGDGMVILFGVILFLLVLLITFLFPYLSRISNKFTPLEEGELRTRLTELLSSHGYHVRDIKVMDASRRTTKSNAYIAGLGKTKTIVLYDTLLSAATAEEICAVFAHEMGHGLHHDNLRMQLLSIINMAVIALCAWFNARTAAMYTDFGFAATNFGFAIYLLSTVQLPLITPLLGLLRNHFSRRAEYAADAQAVAEGYGPALMSALRKLHRENFSNPAPSPLLVLLDYSHPTLSQRLTAIEKGIAEKRES